LPVAPALPAVPQIPLVLVVDDSITVRRVTQRLLQREGYRVAWRPTACRRSSGWPRSVRRWCCPTSRCRAWTASTWPATSAPTPRWAGLPIVMITSRIAEKHREHAKELGVNHYLGKPYSEEELLSLVKHYSVAGQAVA
jgi:chemosensory pili system protein ChpA (sensor histidine kinase/response regulator)